jgi:hypothetical protein
MRMLPVLLLLSACEEAASLPEEALPPVNPNLAVDRTYVLDLQGATFTQPPGLGPMIPALTGGSNSARAWTVLGVRQGQTLVRFGTVDAGQQDLCGLTTDVALRSGPGGQFGGRGAGPLFGHLDSADHAYFDYQLSGRLGAGAQSIDDIRFQGAMDASRWTAAIGSPVCGLFLVFGVSCGVCPHGGAPECLDMAFEDAVATWDPNLPPLRRVTLQTRSPGCP